MDHELTPLLKRILLRMAMISIISTTTLVMIRHFEACNSVSQLLHFGSLVPGTLLTFFFLFSTLLHFVSFWSFLVLVLPIIMFVMIMAMMIKM